MIDINCLMPPCCFLSWVVSGQGLYHLANSRFEPGLPSISCLQLTKLADNKSVLPSNGRVLATGWLSILEGLLHILKVSLSKIDSCQHAIPLKEVGKKRIRNDIPKNCSCRDRYWLPENCNSVTALSQKLLYFRPIRHTLITVFSRR
jgi:hypothetical protein